MNGNIDKVREDIYEAISLLRKVRHGKKLLPISHCAIDRLDKALAALSAIDPEEKRCPSCSCVVDEYGRGHHSAADCVFMHLEASEAIRRECAEKADEAVGWNLPQSDRDELRSAILSTEPAQDDGKPGVGDAVIYFPIEARGKAVITQYESWHNKEFGEFVVLMRAAEVKRRLEEAKE